MASEDEWKVYEYEEIMFNEMVGVSNDVHSKWFNRNIQNAFTESLVLHTRNLADILLSRKEKDDIKLDELLPGFAPRQVETLRGLYGDRNTEKSPCWTFNKMLVHSTKKRSDRFDYSEKLNEIVPTMVEIMAQVKAEGSKRQAAQKQPEPAPMTASAPAREPAP